MLVRTEPDADHFLKATYSLSVPTDASTLFLLKNNQPLHDSDTPWENDLLRSLYLSFLLSHQTPH